jgi:hypothetical protein
MSCVICNKPPSTTTSKLDNADNCLHLLCEFCRSDPNIHTCPKDKKPLNKKSKVYIKQGLSGPKDILSVLNGGIFTFNYVHIDISFKNTSNL